MPLAYTPPSLISHDSQEQGGAKLIALFCSPLELCLSVDFLSCLFGWPELTPVHQKCQ